METSPRISVIMGVYNCEKHLAKAIQSILNQTFKDFEFIIINDGSTDGSEAIIKSFSDPRIKFISQANIGLTKSLNKALKLAKGGLIARMDADDIAYPERFAKEVKFLEQHPEIMLCGTWAKYINAQGEIIGDFKTLLTDNEIKKSLLKHNPFIHPSVMVRKELFDKVGYYNENYRYVQDYELWGRVVPKFKTANIPEYLMEYTTRLGLNRYKNLLGRWLTLKNRCSILARMIFG